MFYGPKFFYWMAGLFALYCCKTSWPDGFFSMLFWVGVGATVLLLLLDATLLWRSSWLVRMRRTVSNRMSCGDTNQVTISLLSTYPSVRNVEIRDEAPDEFQMRDFKMSARLTPGEIVDFTYDVRPVRRGSYQFEAMNVFVSTGLGLLQRRFRLVRKMTVTVCPAFHFVRSAQILSLDNYKGMIGEHKTRHHGQSQEFDSIREYVKGDDYRSINWKATARRTGKIMVNQYVEETRQTVFCVIDKGRGMQHAFDGLTLMDHAINAAVRLSYVVMRHSDDAGIITFEKKVDTWIKPKCNPIGQFNLMIDKLCRETSSFSESDFTALEQHVRTNVSRRSLMVLFSTFDSLASLRRRLPTLRSLAQRHLLLLVFFEDSDMHSVATVSQSKGETGTAHDYIVAALAQNAIREKRQMVRELRRNGVEALLTSAAKLNLDVVNRYLSLKASGRI